MTDEVPDKIVIDYDDERSDEVNDGANVSSVLSDPEAFSITQTFCELVSVGRGARSALLIPLIPSLTAVAAAEYKSR